MIARHERCKKVITPYDPLLFPVVSRHSPFYAILTTNISVKGTSFDKKFVPLRRFLRRDALKRSYRTQYTKSEA